MSTPHDPQAVADALAREFQAQLHRKIAEQPAFKRYANTATTAVGGVAQLAVWLAAFQLDLPAPAVYAIGALLFVAQLLGVKATPNGLTASAAQKAAAPDVIEALAQRLTGQRPVSSPPPAPRQ